MEANHVLYGRFSTEEKVISSSDLKAERTSFWSFSKQAGFLRSRLSSPDSIVAVVSEPAMILSIHVSQELRLMLHILRDQCSKRFPQLASWKGTVETLTVHTHRRVAFVLSRSKEMS